MAQQIFSGVTSFALMMMTSSSRATTFLTNLDANFTELYAGIGGGGGIALTDLSATSPLNYDNTTGVFSIASTSVSNWNTAYGWGNHAIAGYATSGHTHSGLISGLTANYIPKATAANTIADSGIYTTGTRTAFNKTAVAPSLTDTLEINFGHIKFNAIPGPTLGTWAAALAGAGAGNVDNGIHYYYCKYVGENGTTGYESAEISVTVVDKTADGKVNLTGIPVAPTGYGVTQRKLYRTVAGSSNRYLAKYLATITNNTATTYTDNIADASLSSTDTYYVSPNTTAGKIYRDSTVIFFIEQYTTTAGWGAGANITTGGANTLFGSYAGQSLTQGASNSFFGAGSVGSQISTGGSNSAFGSSALRGAANTSSCCAFGVSALQYCAGNGIVGIGVGAGLRVTIGTHSTFIGHGSGQLLQSGNPQNSIAIGSYTYTYKNYQTMIGSLDGAGIMLPNQETIHNGDLHVRRVNSLGTEVLNNPTLTSGTNWSVTNDCAIASDAAKWTFSAGTASTLTQLSSAFDIPLKGNRWYRFWYQVSGVTGTITHPIASITTDVANEISNIYVSANGSYHMYFKTKAVPGNFVITATLTSGQSFTLDTFSLKEVIGGDIYVNKDVYVNDKIGIGTISPNYALDAVGTINASVGFRCGGTAAMADGTYSGITSITVKGGIITAIT